MADHLKIDDEAFHGLARDISVRLPRPSPLTLARRATRRRLRQLILAASTAIATVSLGGAALVQGFSAAENVPDHPTMADTTSPEPRDDLTTAVRCEKVDESTHEVASGIRLSWSSEFTCGKTSAKGSFGLTIHVASAISSENAISLDTMKVTRTGPRSDDDLESYTGSTQLPLVLDAGNAANLNLRGTYNLAATDEGRKATVRFRLVGHAVLSGARLSVDVVVHLLAPGAMEEDLDLFEPQKPNGPRNESRDESTTGSDRDPDSRSRSYVEQMRRWARCVARLSSIDDWTDMTLDPMAECGRRP